MWNSVIVLCALPSATAAILARDSLTILAPGPDLALYDRLVAYWDDHSVIFGATAGARSV